MSRRVFSACSRPWRDRIDRGAEVQPGTMGAARFRREAEPAGSGFVSLANRRDTESAVRDAGFAVEHRTKLWRDGVILLVSRREDGDENPQRGGIP